MTTTNDQTRESGSWTASDYRGWEAAGLKDYGDFAECVEYRNQKEDYCDSLRGDWFYGDDDTLTLYTGSFGNDHSPGASHYTYAERFDTAEEYRAAVARWEGMDEYLPSEDEDEADDDSDDDDDGEEGEGEEPEEGDYTTEDHQRFYQYGKLVLTVPEGADHVAALLAHMEAEGMFPDAWFVSDHGNAHRIDLGS